MKTQQRSLSRQEISFSSTLHPVLQRVYHARGVICQSELNLDLSQMHPVGTLKGVQQAAQLLHQGIESDHSILIIGDYDADGATSTALAILALRAFGCHQVSYLVPNRFEFGYGLTPEIVELAAEKSPDLIVTVDNGISSHSGVRRAAELGIPVLITDHHLPAEDLPEAAVIVNPNQPDDSFSSRHLAGVGVTFYVIAALFNRLKSIDWFQQRNLPIPNPADWLDLVALGTISDLVPLDRNNRILVWQGLRRIRAGRCRPGILALLELAKRSSSTVVASDIGFAVGPRLNAAGRLEDMGLGIECLLSESMQEARIIAQKLDGLNQERRNIEREMKLQAEQILEEKDFQNDGLLPNGLCLYDKSWHQGVVGILASRIKDKYHRPVIAFADGGEGVLKGSARSVAGLHMRDLLDRIATRQPELISRFGGHAMAAGLSLDKTAFENFKQAFEKEAAEQLNLAMLEGILLTDGELMPDQLNLALAQLLREAGPWGQDFSEPLFEGYFYLRQQRVVADVHLKMVLGSEQGGWSIDAIAFNQPPLPEQTSKVHLAYRLDVNDFRGNKTAQLIVETIQSTHKTKA
ncbi:MAG: single-stranded-DNA-specific exonuclease RecJ [Candidatus Thiodiazotropha sp.]